MKNGDQSQNEVEQLRRGLMRLNAKALGLVLGVVFGSVIFIVTNWLVFVGEDVVAHGETAIGPNLDFLGQIFLGYRVSLFGSIVGFVYGFAVGSIGGAAISVIYNAFSSYRKENRE